MTLASRRGAAHERRGDSARASTPIAVAWRCCDGRARCYRPDLHLFNGPMMSFPWMEMHHKLYPQVAFPGRHMTLHKQVRAASSVSNATARVLLLAAAAATRVLLLLLLLLLMMTMVLVRWCCVCCGALACVAGCVGAAHAQNVGMYTAAAFVRANLMNPNISGVYWAGQSEHHNTDEFKAEFDLQPFGLVAKVRRRVVLLCCACARASTQLDNDR